jgi:hypothetical protein
MSEMTLEFVADEHTDTNKLTIEVQTHPFSGSGWSWTDRASLEAFAAQLRLYPIQSEQPALFTMGYNQLEGDDLIGRIEIGPADPRGNLFVRVEVADPDVRWRRVRAEFRTHYPDLERFVARVAAMLDGGRETATLHGV